VTTAEGTTVWFVEQRQTRSARTTPLVVALIGVLIVAFLLGVGVGAVRIPPGESIRILAHRLFGLRVGSGTDAQHEAVLWTIRLPRVLLAMTVGAALGMSGAALQGVFRNPLADPALIGVSSGGALGAVAAIVLGAEALGLWTLPAAAFVGAVAMSAAVFLLARRDGRVDVITLVLCGVAVNALSGAGIGLLITMADDAQLRDISFWQLGSVGGASWQFLGAAVPFVAVALVVLPTKARALDLLVLGEREARHLGVSVAKTQVTVIGLAALATGASVAVAGILGFVGLIVPHLVRLVNGPGHRALLPASALGGAAVLTIADLVARTIAVPREVPLGVISSLLGAPLFLVLIRRSRHQFGGFA
jgi:iron complex transport system permease protein